MKKITREEWKKHVEAAGVYGGGLKAYCREQAISNSRFHYWKKKLSKAPPVKKASSFATVEVMAPRAAKAVLPDAKWLAEFLTAYARCAS